MLGERINLPQVNHIVRWAQNTPDRLDFLLKATRSDNQRVAANALWCLTHLQEQNEDWLQSRQSSLIDMLLRETHTGKKRMLLQLLRHQSYDSDNLRTDFLDYCLSKINSECEPYAIRCFSLYCSFKMCRFYPELVAELEHHLEMLSTQSLSPGLRSALRSTSIQLSHLKRL